MFLLKIKNENEESRAAWGCAGGLGGAGSVLVTSWEPRAHGGSRGLHGLPSAGHGLGMGWDRQGWGQDGLRGQVGFGPGWG